MAKFQNKYRSESARAQWWDYGNEGAYFITICTKNREHFFGEIINGIMHLSPIGEIVNNEWNISFDIRTELFCDTFVIMPNHIHAIVRINYDTVGTTHGGGTVGTHGRASLQRQTQLSDNIGIAYRSPKSISSFVAGFKSASTKRINQYRHSPKMPVWQPRFHDHIIRNEIEYQRIHNYIVNNPVKWEKDTLFKNKNYDE